MPDSNDPLTDFILTLLDDDEGINEEAYGKMMYALSLMNMNDLVSWLDSNVRATDGRFYVLEGYGRTVLGNTTSQSLTSFQALLNRKNALSVKTGHSR